MLFFVLRSRKSLICLNLCNISFQNFVWYITVWKIPWGKTCVLFASRGKIIRPLFPFSSNCKQGIIALGLRLSIQPGSENRGVFLHGACGPRENLWQVSGSARESSHLLSTIHSFLLPSFSPGKCECKEQVLGNPKVFCGMKYTYGEFWVRA